jgi:hypothetical protein
MTMTMTATTTPATPKIIHLAHPITQAPAEAKQVGYYSQNGRAIGLKLEFADGYAADLTYGEIGRLRQALLSEVEELA